MNSGNQAAFAIALALLSGSPGCSSLQTRGANSEIMLNESFRFHSAAERRQAEKWAVAGDVKAAKRLADYYNYVVLDYKKGRHWLQVAASYGDKQAQHALDEYPIK